MTSKLQKYVSKYQILNFNKMINENETHMYCFLITSTSSGQASLFSNRTFTCQKQAKAENDQIAFEKRKGKA